MDSQLGLKTGDLAIILDTIRLVPGIEKVVVFGSRAKGTNRNGSDIDLAVWCSRPDAAGLLSGILNDETLLPYIFDIINYDHILNNELKSHIDRVGVTIYP